MVFKRLFVVIVAIALVCVAIGAGYLVLSRPAPVIVVPPGPAPTVTFTSPAYGATGTPINAKVVATFSHAMDPSTITASTFMLKSGTGSVSGTVAYDGATATFTPLSILAGLAAHTATITTGAKDATGVALAVNFAWSFTTGPTPDTTSPQVSFVSPAPSAVGIGLNTKALATFSKAMDPATITMTTFTMKHGTTPVAGIVTYEGTTAIFEPSALLAYDTTYTATISTAAKDVAGNALAGSFVWNFRTGQAPETTPPRVSSTSPVVGVPVNSSISAMFTEVMDPSTISLSSFLLYQGTTSVPGFVTYTGLTATFDPLSNLAFDTVYTATITTGAKDLAGNALQGNFVWTFRTSQLPDTTAPRVSSTNPVSPVAVNSSISAMFSEAMDPTTLTVSTFILYQGTSVVQGLVTYAGFTATFDPTSDFAYDTLYTGTITNGVRDLAGNALAGNFVWNFRTGPQPDTTPPRVISTSPVIDVAIDSSISASFTEPMDPATVTVSTFYLYQGTTAVAGLVNYAGTTATFDPTSNLTYETTYTATITTGARDLAGNGLQLTFVWTFRTSQIPDTTRPVVTGTSPLVNVSLNSSIFATFSEAMDPTVITTASFTLAQGSTPVSGLVNYANLTATFKADADFATNTTYTATISTAVKDLAGNTLLTDYVWSFTTWMPYVNPCAQLTVTLGRVSTFAVLAGSTITNTGSTLITGDIGVSPSDAVVGFPPGNVSGSIYISNTVDAAQAMENLTVAYNDAAGRTLCPVSVAGNIGGQTLAPGLYKSTSTLAISSGDLTLDAQGDANAIFIFQIASTLDTSSGLKVILAGGAKASNIFWQVGTSATLGTNSVFKGTIMADQAISLGTGATLDGRALARIAAVSLDANVVVVPA